MLAKKIPVITGAIVGISATITYMWENYSPAAEASVRKLPDPAWLVMVNSILILFVSIFASVRLSRWTRNLYHRLTGKSG